MAKSPTRIVLNKESQRQVVKYLQSVLQAKRNFSQFISKLSAIDVGYYCYQALKQKDAAGELDINRIVPHDRVDIGLIVSQVDSLRAYFADVYLSGTPLFPVASSVGNSDLAERFEQVLDAHALRGRYARQLLLYFTHLAKYNFAAMEATWDTIPPFLPDFADSSETEALSTSAFALTKLRTLDPYNTLVDYRVAPADVPYNAEYAGDVQLISRNALKRLTNELSRTNAHMNVREAFTRIKLSLKDGTLSFEKPKDGYAEEGYTVSYTMKPQVSHFLQSDTFRQGGTWEDFISKGDFRTAAASAYPNISNMYELVTLYCRIIPAEYGIKTRRANTPQIWRFRLINGYTLISAEPIVTPHEIMPVLVAQPHEDGFAYQTHSVAESQLPLQRASSDLLNVFMASAKRAVNDRMLYDPNMVSPTDINSKVPAAKIPVRSLPLGKSLNDAAKHLPFDSSATANSMSNMQQTIGLSYMLTGLNPFRQGQTQKGNRTLEEFNSIISFSDMRTRVLALAIEMQLMLPLKEILKFNILLNADSLEVISTTTGNTVRITKAELLQQGIEFRVADGFTPKSRLMSTDDLQIALQFIQQNDQLKAEYDVGKMFAHLMSLRGIKGLSDYRYTEEGKQALLAKAIPIIQELTRQQNDKLPQDAQGGTGEQPAPAQQTQQPQ